MESSSNKSCCGCSSDCAAHNEPAYPNGPCDCGNQAKVDGRYLTYVYHSFRIRVLRTPIWKFLSNAIKSLR